MEQRRTVRVENLGLRFAFAINDFFAINSSPLKAWQHVF